MSMFKKYRKIKKTKSTIRNCWTCMGCIERFNIKPGPVHPGVCMDTVCIQRWYLRSHVCDDFKDVHGVRKPRQVRKL